MFQAFDLMPAMTVAQNVELPGRLAGKRPERGRVLVALFLAVATMTLFGSLFAADVPASAAARKAVEGPGSTVIAGAFGEIAVLIAFFVVVNALGFALRRQHRELALLRTVAPTPRQARRLVRGQVVAATPLVTAPGWVVGAVGARLGLRPHDGRRGRAVAPILAGGDDEALGDVAQTTQGRPGRNVGRPDQRRTGIPLFFRSVPRRRMPPGQR